MLKSSGRAEHAHSSSSPKRLIYTGRTVGVGVRHELDLIVACT